MAGMDSSELSIQMTGEIQKNMLTCCGIPLITLDGTQDDWQSILTRIDKLHEFGDEPTEWAGMLRAILRRFVRAFDAGGPETDKEFWERMVHEKRGSGTYWLGGWLSVFCAWDSKGTFFTGRQRDHRALADQQERGVKRRWPDAWALNMELDGIRIPRSPACPDGYAEVDVEVIDENTKSWDCSMLAGHVGISLGGDQLDTLHIAPQWFMYVKGVTQKEEEKKRVTKVLQRMRAAFSLAR
ncbi:hypothetical protein H0H87_002004 [Tephrocybe sp. NHM501043]|nr:hypothetical protein H0H87_002004 [Tephrocybe sp. NHM501043]